MFGIGLIALGIFVAVMGGFLLNAETVTTCETEWEYVTDIGGAFTGSTADMDVDYDPTATITGWSAVDSARPAQRISGVDFRTTSSTNLFRTQTGDVSYVPYTLTASAMDHDGVTRDIRTFLGVAGAGEVEGQWMAEDFGLYGSEAATVFTNAEGTHYGAFATPLSNLSLVVPGYRTDLSSVVVEVQSSSGYPCIAAVDKSVGKGSFSHAGNSYNAILASFNAYASASTATVYVAEGAVQIGDTKVPIGDALLVWGQAQFDGRGSYVADVTASLTGTLGGQFAYLDASQGVRPVQGRYTENSMAFVAHDGSSSPTLDMSFSNVRNGAKTEVYGQGTVSYRLPGSSATVQAATWEFQAGTNDTAFIRVVPTGGEALTSAPDDGRGAFSMSVSSGVLTFTVDGGGTGTFQMPSGTSMAAIIVTVGGSQAIPSYVLDVAKDDGTGYTYESTSATTYDMPLDYVAYTSTPTTTLFYGAYWLNGQDNASMTLVLADSGFSDEPPTAGHADYPGYVTYYGPLGTKQVNFRCNADGTWVVSAGQGIQIGSWPAVELVFDEGSLSVRPISAFRSFLDYDVVDSPVPVSSDLGIGETVEKMFAHNTSLRMCVTSTTARIAQGGLFLQDASMTLGQQFPDARAVSVMLGSAARMGQGVTFSSGGQSATLAVDPDRQAVRIGGTWYPFNGVTFRWYSSAGPSATVEGQTYAPAVYHNGKVYAAGKIWAEPKGRAMVEVMDAPTDWTMALDGVWAPSVFMYTGENVASSATELNDIAHPSFQWSKDDFVLVMMAVSVFGGVIGSYFGRVDAWDWVAIIGTVGGLWLIL